MWCIASLICQIAAYSWHHDTELENYLRLKLKQFFILTNLFSFNKKQYFRIQFCICIYRYRYRHYLVGKTFTVPNSKWPYRTINTIVFKKMASHTLVYCIYSLNIFNICLQSSPCDSGKKSIFFCSLSNATPLSSCTFHREASSLCTMHRQSAEDGVPGHQCTLSTQLHQQQAPCTIVLMTPPLIIKYDIENVKFSFTRW